MSGRIKDVIFVRGQNYFAHDLEEIIYELDTIDGNIALVGHFNSKTSWNLAFINTSLVLKISSTA